MFEWFVFVMVPLGAVLLFIVALTLISEALTK